MRLFVVINDTKDDISCSVYNTRLKAQKAIAEYIMRQPTNLRVELNEAFAEKDWNGVMEIWNGHAIEDDKWDTFSIQERMLDAPL